MFQRIPSSERKWKEVSSHNDVLFFLHLLDHRFNSIFNKNCIGRMSTAQVLAIATAQNCLGWSRTRFWPKLFLLSDFALYALAKLGALLVGTRKYLCGSLSWKMQNNHSVFAKVQLEVVFCWLERRRPLVLASPVWLWSRRFSGLLREEVTWFVQFVIFCNQQSYPLNSCFDIAGIDEIRDCANIFFIKNSFKVGRAGWAASRYCSQIYRYM